MDARQQDQIAQAPPPPWDYHPLPHGGTYQPHYPHNQAPHLPPLPPHQQQQPYHHQPPLPWPPTQSDHSQYQYQTRPIPAGPPPPPTPFPPPPPPPPAPGPYNHGGPPPPYPGPFHHPPQPPSYIAAAPPQNYPPPSNQIWGNSSWRHTFGWENPDRSISYNNEEDWAARARAWAEGKSSTDNHHTPMQFTPIGKMEVHNLAYQESFQQGPGPAEIQQFSYSASQQYPVSLSATQEQISHLEDRTQLNVDLSSCHSDARTSCVTRPEGHDVEKATSHLHVNFVSVSSVSQQEVSSSYSSFPGKIDGDQQETLHTPLPSSAMAQEGFHKLEPALPIQSTEHHIHRNQFTTVDASDQPLVFERGQNQNISYSSVDAAGSLGGIDKIEAPSSHNAWTQAIAFSHVPPVPSGQQHDSSLQTLPSVNVHPAPMFGRMPAPSFHHSITPVRASFGLGAVAPLQHLSAIPEDGSGAFSPVDRPKKASVPNWLREELLKKKASIASSFQEQPTGNSYSVGTDDGVKSFGKGDWTENKSIDSTRSDEDEDDEDDVEAARSAAITQEIKRILTDILLKVTDDLFEEIATKVIDEDDDCVLEVDNNVSTKIAASALASAAPKSSAKIPVPMPGNGTKVGHVENPSSVSPKGNILGLANYVSDDDDEIQSSVVTSSLPTSMTSQPLDDNISSENMVKEMEGGASPNKVEESNSDLRGGKNGGKETSDEKFLLSERNNIKNSFGLHVANDKSGKDAFGVITAYGEGLISAPAKKVENLVSRNGSEPDIEGELVHDLANGQFILDESRKARLEPGPTNRHTDKKSHEGIETGLDKVAREYSDASQHKRGDTKRQSKEGFSKSSHLRIRSKDGGHLSEKDMEISTSRKRVIRESERMKEHEEDSKARHKAENRKRDQIKNVKEDKAGKGQRDSYRSKRAHSPSPGGRAFYDKNNFASHGGASSGEVSDDRRRKPRSDKCSLSRSPSQSKRRQISRSPPAKHSQRRHSPYTYSDRRRKSRSSSPVQHRR